MRISLILICISAFAFSTALQAQDRLDTLWKPSGIFYGEFSDFSIDHLGNSYLINENGQLKKIDEKGDSSAVFNDIKRYGRLHSIEVSNPLRILLFYKDFGTVVILDRFLNPRAEIDLRRHGFYNVSAIALSYDNQIWIYDALESKLKKISEEGRLLSETPDFRMLFNPVPEPEIIIDQDKKLYVYDNKTGLKIFDYFGTLQTSLAFTGWSSFTVSGGVVYGIKDSNVQRYSPGTLKMDEIPLPEISEEAKKMIIRPWGIYFLTKKGIMRFDYEEK